MQDKRVMPLVRTLEKLNWRIERRRRGFMCFPPDPMMPPLVIHLSPSDHRWYRNAIAELRKHGYQQ